MSQISAQLVKDLREKTGAGMMECKKALEETSGSLDGAVEYLRKKGLNAASKKEGRVASDGLVVTYVSPDGATGILLELNSETDFVAKNEEFQVFSRELAELLAKKAVATVDEALTLKTSDGQTVSERLNLLIAKIGEKLSFRRFVRFTGTGSQKIGSYIHLGQKIGVLLMLEGDGATEEVLKDVAMHVAASHPQYLQTKDIPASVLEKEKEIYRAQMKDSGKPAEILEKIIIGKAAKFSKEVCLIDQVFIKDPSGKQTVADYLKTANPSLKIASFIRYQVGEGLEKKADNFADEVKKMVG